MITQAGEIVAVSATNGQQTVLARIAPSREVCSWTNDLLACRDGAQLRLWRFQR